MPIRSHVSFTLYDHMNAVTGERASTTCKRDWDLGRRRFLHPHLRKTDVYNICLNKVQK